MKLDRKTIKNQAKQLIKTNVIALFFISFIVALCVSGGTIINNGISLSESLSSVDSADETDDFDFNFGGNNWDKNYFDDFKSEGKISVFNAAKKLSGKDIALAVISKVVKALVLIQIFMAPLVIALVGIYIELAKGSKPDFNSGISFVFKSTFKGGVYGKRLLLTFFMDLFTGLLCLLLVFPGIIFYYKYRFAPYVMYEYPNLSWKEAMKVSRKMNDGHKGELFELDLSFILWFLAIFASLGIASIYVTPYYATTMALYYENYKIRALRDGSLQKYDFMSEAEKTAQFYKQMQQGGYVPYTPNYSGQNYYRMPQQPYYPQQPPQQPPYTPPAQNQYGSGMGTNYYNNYRY